MTKCLKLALKIREALFLEKSQHFKFENAQVTSVLSLHDNEWNLRV